MRWISYRFVKDFLAFAAQLLDNKQFKRHKSDKVYEHRCNLYGGSELLEVNNHVKRGSVIVFADRHVKFSNLDSLRELRWKIEGKEVFPESLFAVDKSIISMKYTAVLLISLPVLLRAAFIVYKNLSKKYITSALLLGLVSGGAGCFLGSLAEWFYRVRDFHGIGMMSGSILGFLVGVCYCAVLTGTCVSLKDRKAIKGYAVSLGMAAGVICSTLVHLVLMIMHEEPEPFGIYAGMPFGIFAGAVLGAICGSFVKVNTLVIGKTDAN